MLKPFSYTLIIIDMQPGFMASHKSTLNENIMREIKIAKKNKQGILILEYDRKLSGRTHKEILNQIRNYPFKVVVEKLNCDGCEEVLEQFKEHPLFLNKNHIKICGVNTDECVNDTTVSLYEQLYKNTKIEVLADCCNTHMDSRPKDDDPFDWIEAFCSNGKNPVKLIGNPLK